MDTFDTHLRLHAARAGELARAAAEHRAAAALAPPGRLARLLRRPALRPEPECTPAVLRPPRPPKAPHVIDLDAAVVVEQPTPASREQAGVLR